VSAASDRAPGLAQPTWDINHVIATGQSLAVGYEGWPALSLTQPHDSLMLGESVRPAQEEATAWRPVGAAAFRPLVATVAAPGGGALLAPEQVAALPPGDAAAGETVLEGAVNFWRGRQLAAGGVPGLQRLLASTAGVGGRSIEMLARGAVPPLFDRLGSCARLARDVAAAERLSYGVVALLFLQGEHNARGAEGCTSDRAAYRALLATLHRDMLAEVAAVSGQAAPPALFSYQTGGAYANEGNSIAQAQLDFVLATLGCFMVGPSYPVTEKFGHLDANGYRWLGAQFGKVMHRVLTLGQEFRPLHPLGATLAGRRLRVRFHVPVPPLTWGQPFSGQSYAEPPDAGFAVLDAAGEVTLADLQQDGADGVELTLAREPVGAVTLRYADATRGGRGALRDSDPEVAADPYVYDPATGHYETANHPHLNGRPYRLHNWCVAFAIPVQTAPAVTPPVAARPPPPVAPVPPVAPPVAPPPAAAPARRTGGAWDTLRTTRTDVTGQRLPERAGWFARLGQALLGGHEAAAPPPPAPLAMPPEVVEGRFASIAEPDYVAAAGVAQFGRAGMHERLKLFAAEPAPPQRPAHDEARLPPAYVAEHHGIAAPEAVAAYAVGGGVLWSTGLVTLGPRFIAPPDCVPGYFRQSFGAAAPPLPPIHAGGLGRTDIRTITLARPVMVATHPNLGYGHFLLEVLPRLWLASVLRQRGADMDLALSHTVPPWVKQFAHLLHAEKNIVWYDGLSERLCAPSIVLPGMLHSDYNFHPATNRMVADVVQRAGPAEAAGPTHVYLARAGFGDERMTNAAEIEAAMRDLGFAVVRLDERDAAQQVRLFAGAAVVVAEHADALYGTLFAPPGTRVVAINFANSHVSAIARLRGHLVAYVPPADGQFRHWRLGFGLSRSWAADVAEVRRVVAEMIDSA